MGLLNNCLAYKMDEFEQRKRNLLQPIYFEAGAALYGCQSFEFGIAYLLYLFSRLGVTGLDTKRAESTLEDEEKKTAGQLIGGAQATPNCERRH